MSTSLLREEVLRLRDRFDDEPVHSDHVTALALQIFDALKSWHRLGDRSRDLLMSGALLHDIGWSQTIEGKGHHKKSAQLIRDTTWQKLQQEEVGLVAQIARYHRRSIPADHHAEFQALDEGARKKVMILGGILRIADALDRSHIQKISRVDARVTDKAIVVMVESASEWEAEKAIFDAKREMLERVAGRPVNVRAK